MKKTVWLIFIISLVFSLDVEAQCSMCRFAAESSYTGGSDIGKGLNNGIVYMMFLPYLILITLGIVFFRKQIRAKLGI